MEIDKNALDRWITGNWGEDQFKCYNCGGSHDDEDEDFVCDGPPERDPDQQRDEMMERDWPDA